MAVLGCTGDVAGGGVGREETWKGSYAIITQLGLWWISGSALTQHSASWGVLGRIAEGLPILCGRAAPPENWAAEKYFAFVLLCTW